MLLLLLLRLNNEWIRGEPRRIYTQYRFKEWKCEGRTHKGREGGSQQQQELPGSSSSSWEEERRSRGENRFWGMSCYRTVFNLIVANRVGLV